MGNVVLIVGIFGACSAIPEDGRRKAYAEAAAKAKAEEEARLASEKALEAVEAAKKLEEEVKKLEDQEARAATLAEEAEAKAAAAGASVEGLFDKAKEIGSGLSWGKFSSQFTAAVQKPAELDTSKDTGSGTDQETASGLSWGKLTSQFATAIQKPSDQKPKVQIATVRGQAKARTLPAKRAVLRQPAPKPPALRAKEPPKPKAKPAPESKAEVRKLLGGLFQQETIYVDED